MIHCQPSDEHCSCGGAWVGREAFTRIQVTDIPEIRPTVTEYHERCFSCARCERETYARANLPLGESRFGPKIHAFVLDLNLGSRLSYRQIKGHLKRHHNISVSVWAFSEMIKRSTALTKTAFEDLKRWFQEDMSPKHVDETSWRLRDLKTQLIGALNAHAVLFQCSLRRKAEDVIKLIGSDLSRWIICDRAPVYQAWLNRQLCWAHVLRDFHFLATYSVCQAQAEQLVKHAQSLFKAYDAYQSGELSDQQYLKIAKELRGEVSSLLQALGFFKISKKADGMIRNLVRFEAQLWTFLQNPSLPIHNNQQESALRPLVLKCLISFGNDTVAGADRLAQLMSIIETLKRQGRDVCSWFISSFTGEASSLIPSTTAL